MYYVMETQHHELVGMIASNDEGVALIFTKGRYIDPDQLSQLTVNLESEPEQLPDYFELDGTPIVSHTFLSAVKDLLGEHCQILPIKVMYRDKVIGEYYVLNILNKIPCIDVKASNCQMYKTKMMRMNKLCLLKEFDQTKSIFRAKEYALAIMVNEVIYSTLSALGLSGLMLTKALGWSDTHRF